MRSPRRQWPVILLAAALLGVGAVYLIVEGATREPPNYTRVDEGLYLGGFVPQPPPGARAVLNLCSTADPYQVEVHRWQPIRDGTPVPSLDWLRREVEFIEAQRQAGRVVFVHCRNGISRGGLVVAAYLMLREGWSRDEALAFVRSRRPGVRPNPAFRDLLLRWQESLREAKGKGSAPPG